MIDRQAEQTRLLHPLVQVLFPVLQMKSALGNTLAQQRKGMQAAKRQYLLHRQSVVALQLPLL